MFVKSFRTFQKFKRYGWMQPAMTVFGIPVPNHLNINKKIIIPEHKISFVPLSQCIEFECYQLICNFIWGPYKRDDYNDEPIPGTFPVPKLDSGIYELNDLLKNHDTDEIINYNKLILGTNGQQYSAIEDYYGYYVFGLWNYHKTKE
jgi:hypothetical protein